MDNQYSYYQNLYNMFGGYNPLVDKKVAALRRLGFIIGCGMICFTLMQYAVAALLQIFGVYSLYQSDALFQTGISAIAPIVYVLLPFVLVYFLYNTEQKNSVDIFNLPKSKELFLFSVFTGLLVCSIGDRATAVFSSLVSVTGVDFEKPDTLEANTPLGWVLQLAAYAVIPPLVEEFAMRGVVMQPLRKYGDKFAIVVSAVLFAVLHGNMVQIPFAFIAGLALGYFAIITNSIWTSVAIHCLNNLSATIISIYYTNHSQDDMFFFYVIEGSILMLGVAAFILFMRLKPERLGKNDAEIGNRLLYSTVFCTPSVVVSLFICLLNTLSFTKINTAGGIFFTVASIAVIAFFLIKGAMNARKDVRIKKSTMYNVSIAITVIASFFIMYFVMIIPFRG